VSVITDGGQEFTSDDVDTLIGVVHGDPLPGKNGFNDDISGWITENVVSMDRMFTRATDFNQPIGNWDVSRVTSMEKMFTCAASFDQDISSWVTSKVRAKRVCAAPQAVTPTYSSNVLAPLAGRQHVRPFSEL
jgi:surface protein